MQKRKSYMQFIKKINKKLRFYSLMKANALIFSTPGMTMTMYDM